MSLDAQLQSAFTAVGNTVKGKISSSEKGVALGVATLDAGGKIPAAQMPSSVDEIIEYANYAALPGTGIASKIYVTLDTNKTYRWSGSTYTEVSPSEVNSVNGMTGAVVIGNATTGSAGLMSSSDKTKLDGIATGANNYVLPASASTTVGGVKLGSDTVQTTAANAVTSTASKSYALQVNATGQGVVNVPWTDTTYTNATTSTAGLMSAADKTALDNVGATNTDYVSVFNAALV